MSKTIFLLSLILSSSLTLAAPCISKDGFIFEEDFSAKLFLVQNPKKELGPAYSCDMVSRMVYCNDGYWESTPVECRDKDSGGCKDFWIDLLENENFQYGTCRD